MIKIFLYSILFPALLLSIQTVEAQIGGISGSKINAYSVDIVEKHQLELEPLFSLSSSRYRWNDNRERRDLFQTSDSLAVSSGMSLRFTYGLLDKMEIGVVYPFDGTSASWGFRYVLREEKNTGLAVIGGLNTPFGNGIRNTAGHTTENTFQAGAGFVLSQSFGDRFSLDMNFEACRYLRKPLDSPPGYFQLAADAGYYVLDHKLQLITGLGYQSTFAGSPVQSVLTLYPGVTIETGKRFIIIISNSFDLLGRNSSCESILQVSATITFD